ncbi:unnamed protein product, partial [Tetraodon nigroviridis]
LTMVVAHASSHPSESAEWIICLDKRPAERSGEDVDIILARLRRVKALERFHPSVLQQICRCGFYECLEKGITLYRQGDIGTSWYAVLSGSLDVKVSETSYHQDAVVICTLGTGTAFGESILDNTPRHATIVTRECTELLRIEQRAFRSLWEMQDDRCQPIMKLLLSEDQSGHCDAETRQLILLSSLSGHRKDGGDGAHLPRYHHCMAGLLVPPYGVMESACSADRMPNTENISDDAFVSADKHQNKVPSENVLRAGKILRNAILSGAPHMIRDRKYHLKTYRRCCVGTELVDWQMQQSSCVRSRVQAVGMWQVLLEEGVLSQGLSRCDTVDQELSFQDKYLFYRFLDDEQEDAPFPSEEEERESQEELQDALLLLSQIGPDAHMRMILRKQYESRCLTLTRRPSERTADDLEIIYEELLHIKALSHLSTTVKRQLAGVLIFESHTKAGTVLFSQGEEGTSWYIILKGSVNVVIYGKGVVCTLHEGDDFGKLALVNDAPRAASIVLREDNCHFLRVDKEDFNRILRVSFHADVTSTAAPWRRGPGSAPAMSASVCSYYCFYMCVCVCVCVCKGCGSQHSASKGARSGRFGAGEESWQQSNLRPRSLVLPVQIHDNVRDPGEDPGASPGDDAAGLPVHRVRFGLGRLFAHPPRLHPEQSAVSSPHGPISSQLSKGSIRPLLLFHLYPSCTYHAQASQGCEQERMDYTLNNKRRVIRLVMQWAALHGDHLQDEEDSVVFLQEFLVAVSNDAKVLPALRDQLAKLETTCGGRQGLTKKGLNRFHPFTFIISTEVIVLSCHRVCLTFWQHKVFLRQFSTGEEKLQKRQPIRSNDEILFKVYCCDNTYTTIRASVAASVRELMGALAEKLGSAEDLLLVSLGSAGEKVIFKPNDVSVFSTLGINGRLFVCRRDELDSLSPLPEQVEPSAGLSSNFELMSSKDVACHMTSYDWELFSCVHEFELIYHTFGRQNFRKTTVNLDLFLRRFNEIQFWVITEMCLCSPLSKRVQLLKKFIKIAAHCKDYRNLNGFFAVTMGLSNPAVGRLSLTWEVRPGAAAAAIVLRPRCNLRFLCPQKLPSKFRKFYREFENLMDPSRNHRAYRLTAAKLDPPIIPFMPLLIKDMTFAHEGNKTFVDNLVNFEKMRMIANTVKILRHCRSQAFSPDSPPAGKNHSDVRAYVRQFNVIDNQRTLTQLSHGLEPPRP